MTQAECYSKDSSVTQAESYSKDSSVTQAECYSKDSSVTQAECYVPKKVCRDFFSELSSLNVVAFVTLPSLGTLIFQ